MRNSFVPNKESTSCVRMGWTVEERAFCALGGACVGGMGWCVWALMGCEFDTRVNSPWMFYCVMTFFFSALCMENSLIGLGSHIRPYVRIFCCLPPKFDENFKVLMVLSPLRYYAHSLVPFLLFPTSIISQVYRFTVTVLWNYIANRSLVLTHSGTPFYFRYFCQGWSKQVNLFKVFHHFFQFSIGLSRTYDSKYAHKEIFGVVTYSRCLQILSFLSSLTQVIGHQWTRSTSLSPSSWPSIPSSVKCLL